MLNLDFEKSVFYSGYNNVAGVDEAGRGPLAGPVVAGCVLIGRHTKIDKELMDKCRDSKKLTEKKRKYLFDLITKKIEHYAIGVCDVHVIDKINILEATFLAMKKAISNLQLQPDFVLVDGKIKIKNLNIEQEAIVKGDSQVLSIALASILAKVTRDMIMEDLHKKYPNYSFDKHKGYGTKLHMERLQIFGPSLVHRTSFRPVSDLIKK
ncbi:ribonuclease HII [Candidatus Parcubacteria bacterium]|nr:MAG: ribonuclease HII [Candidatus Parcubacteria bacterium]